ncbi:MAG: hypothetical protein WD960_05600 [Gemmatimonadota bacterium]
MRRPTCRLALLPALATIAVACAEPGERSDEIVVRDSAGVVITENPVARRTPPQRLTLAPEPDLLIGLEEGPPELLFQWIWDAAPVNDTLLMVVEWMQREVRLFRSDGGSFVSRFGGAGEGPGEFQIISFARPLGEDEILLADGGSQRLTWWNWRTGEVRTEPIEQSVDGRGVSPMDALADGTVVGVTGTRGFGPADASTVIADTMRYYLFEPDGSAGPRIHLLPGRLRWGLQAGGRIGFPFIPFSVDPSMAVGDDVIYLATGTEPRVEIFHRSGEKVRELRWDAGDRTPVSDAPLDQLLAHQVQEAGADEIQLRTLHREAPLPDSLPIFQSLFVDADGRLWVERYRFPWESERRWDLFDRDDRWIGEVVTERDFDPHHASGDEVLGVLIDEMGIQRMARFELQEVD